MNNINQWILDEFNLAEEKPKEVKNNNLKPKELARQLNLKNTRELNELLISINAASRDNGHLSYNNRLIDNKLVSMYEYKDHLKYYKTYRFNTNNIDEIKNCVNFKSSRNSINSQDDSFIVRKYDTPDKTKYKFESEDYQIDKELLNFIKINNKIDVTNLILFNTYFNRAVKIARKNGFVSMGMKQLNGYLNSTNTSVKYFKLMTDKFFDLHNSHYIPGEKSKSYKLREGILENSEYVNLKEIIDINKIDFEKLKGNKVSREINKEMTDIMNENFKIKSNLDKSNASNLLIASHFNKGVSQRIDKIGRVTSALSCNSKDKLKDVIESKSGKGISCVDLSMTFFKIMCKLMKVDSVTNDYTYEKWMEIYNYKKSREEFKKFFMTKVINGSINKKVRKKLDSRWLKAYDELFDMIMDKNVSPNMLFQDLESKIFNTIALNRGCSTRYDEFIFDTGKVNSSDLIDDLKKVFGNIDINVKVEKI